MEPHKSQNKFQNAPDIDGIWVTDSFRGTSYALKRDVFLRLGGYREQIIHQGEESDFCIRLLDRGFIARLGFGDMIIHHEFHSAIGAGWTSTGGRTTFYSPGEMFQCPICRAT